MKELSTEEKAKRYDEVIPQLKGLLDGIHEEKCDIMEEDIIKIFHELKEGEDEKIRKWLIRYFKEVCDNVSEKEKKGVLAWLEKQGNLVKYYEDKLDRCACNNFNKGYKKALEKQGEKSVNNVVPKFSIGNWLVQNERRNIVKVVSYTPLDYEVVDTLGYHHKITSDAVENNYHLWSIKDAKDGDVLFQDLMGGKTFIYNGVNPDMAILYSFIISNDGEDVLPYHIGKPNTGIGNIEENKNIIHPATKEQRDLLFQKMKEASYEWDAEKKELKKIEQKPTWSREDEQNLNAALGYINDEYLRRWLKDVIYNKYEKPTDKIAPKFRKGDWIVFNGLTLYVKEVVKGFYITVSNGGITNGYDWDIDNVARLWTIEDAKAGDVLACGNDIVIFKENNYSPKDKSECMFVYCSCNNFHEIGGINPTDYKPATKEQRDLLFQKMKEASYEWDAEKKELKIEQKLVIIIPKFRIGDIIRHKKQGFTCKIIAIDTEYRLSGCNGTHLPFEWQDAYELVEQIPTWSEEDVYNYGIIQHILNNKCVGVADKRIAIEWFKSLKDRVQPQNK